MRTPTLAGTYNDEYNHFPAPTDELAPKIEIVRRAAVEAGRDPDAIEVTVMGPVITGRDEAAFRERLTAAVAGRDRPRGSPRTVDESRYPRRSALQGGRDGGHPRADRVSRYYLQWIDLEDREGLRTTLSAISS